MAAYLFANIEVTDPAGYEEYRQQVPATITLYGGRYLVRAGATEVLARLPQLEATNNTNPLIYRPWG